MLYRKMTIKSESGTELTVEVFSDGKRLHANPLPATKGENAPPYEALHLMIFLTALPLCGVTQGDYHEV